MLDDQALADWLTAIPTDLTVEFQVGPYRPEFMKADTIGLVTPTAGPGEIREGLWDGAAFQIQLVGRDRDRAALKSSAFQIDQALRFGDFPAQLWGTWVTAVGRVGSGPTPLQEDEHQRQAWTCTYFAEISP